MYLPTHSRQFLIACERTNLPEHWLSRGLAEGWYLYHDPHLAIHSFKRLDGSETLVLGNVFGFDAETGQGTGRYAVLNWPHINSDIAGLYGLFYGEGACGKVVGSSVAVVSMSLHGPDHRPEIVPELQHRSRFNFYPVPGTPYHDIRRLIVDQAINIETHDINAINLPIAPFGSYDEALNVLVDELCGFATEVGKRCEGTIYVPLTSGRDSRALFAAFLGANTKFQAATQQFEGKSISDVRVARKICRIYDIPHRTIHADGKDIEIAKRIRAHNSGMVFDWGNTHLFPAHMFRFMREDDIRLVGGNFEIGRQSTIKTTLANADINTITPEELTVADAGPMGDCPAPFLPFYEEWLTWRRAHPQNMHLAQSYFLDQRCGGWRSAMEANHDLVPGMSVHPANNAKVLSALITPGLEEQLEAKLQSDLVRRLAPKIADIPYNPTPLKQQLKRRLRFLKPAFMRKKGPTVYDDPAAIG